MWVAGIAKINGLLTLFSASASQSLATNADKEVISVPNTGTGDNVLGTSPAIATPTITSPTVATSLTASYATASTAAAFDGSKNLVSVPNTGTGNNVLSAAPALTGAATLDGNRIGSFITGTSTWDPANMPSDGDVVSASVPLTGAAVGDPVTASLSSIGANNVLISAHVESADNVRVILMNKTGGAIDIGSGTLRYMVWK